MTEAAHIFGILNGSFNIIAAGIFFAIVFTAIQFRRERTDVAFILTVNSCIASLFTCLTMCIMLCSNFWFGFLTHNMNLCLVIGLFYDFFQCAIYHSYFLQAIFRLFRVVYHRSKSLLSYSLYRVLIIIQWIVSGLCVLPPFLCRWYALLTTEKYCLVPYNPLGPGLYHMTVLYLIPLTCISAIYIWISIYIRRSTRATAETLSGHQKRRNHRDLTMIKRIVMMILILVLMRFPTLVFIIYAIVQGYVHPVAFSVAGSIVSLCLIFIGMITVHYTPRFQNNLCSFIHCRDNRVDVRSSVQGVDGDDRTTGSRTSTLMARKSDTVLPNTDHMHRRSAVEPISTIT